VAQATRIVLLGEDQAHISFAQGFFNAFKYPGARVRVKKAPSGKGDAKDFVQSEMLREIELIGKLNKYQSVRLVVIADCDNLSPVERVKWLLGDSTRPSFLTIITPSNEIENWVSQVLVLKQPDSIRKKVSLARNSYVAGKDLGNLCKQKLKVPEDIQNYCPEVEQLVECL